MAHFDGLHEPAAKEEIDSPALRRVSHKTRPLRRPAGPRVCPPVARAVYPDLAILRLRTPRQGYARLVGGSQFEPKC
ncbi:hypothetical protein BDW66DRAFT_126609 [Aspergillus desertorum]